MEQPGPLRKHPYGLSPHVPAAPKATARAAAASSHPNSVTTCVYPLGQLLNSPMVKCSLVEASCEPKDVESEEKKREKKGPEWKEGEGRRGRGGVGEEGGVGGEEGREERGWEGG